MGVAFIEESVLEDVIGAVDRRVGVTEFQGDTLMDVALLGVVVDLHLGSAVARASSGPAIVGNGS